MAGRTPRQPEVVEQPRERAFVGLLAWTTEEGLFSDAPALARSFGEVKESIPRRALPVVTAVVAFEPGFVPEGVAAPRDGGPGDPAERGAGGPAGAPFAYFMGDEVEPDAKAVREALAAVPGLVCVRVPAGTTLARVPVRVGSQATLALRVARLRSWLHGTWLPGAAAGQGLVSAADELGFADMELYHYRKRRFRRATKMVMELALPVRRARD